MADARDFFVTGPTGTPLTGAAAGMSATARDVVGGVRSATVTEVGDGVYRVTPSDADEAVGTVVCVDTGAGNSPRRVVLACFKPDRTNQFWAVAVENPDGTVWTGSAPTVGSYRSSAGARTPPALVAVAGAWLFVAVPSAADVAADTEIRIDGPAGSAQPYWSAGTDPYVTISTPSPPAGQLRDAANDVAAFLDTKTAGGVTLALATNLFVGPMRAGARTPSPCVFAMNTGGAQPDFYLGGHREGLYRPTVMVQIRGPAADFDTGEKLARGVYEWLQQRVTGGYVSWYARDSAPVLVSVEDSAQHPVWSINLECQYRQQLDA